MCLGRTESRSSLASSAAASHRTLIIFATCSRGARPQGERRIRSMSAHGGRPPVSTRSKPRANSGSTRERFRLERQFGQSIQTVGRQYLSDRIRLASAYRRALKRQSGIFAERRHCAAPPSHRRRRLGTPRTLPVEVIGQPMSLVVLARISRRCSVEEPVTVRPSPRAPERVLRGRRAAARSVPAWVVTSGPTGSDPTSSAPLPPAATIVGGPLDGTSGYSRNNNSRLRVGKRKRTIRQRASCTQSNESSRSSVYYSPHPNLRHARACRLARCCCRTSGRKIVIPETRPYTQLERCHQIRCYCADGLRNGGDSGRAENSLT
jgi:hypothetical protein